MSANPDRSKPLTIARLLRHASSAEAAGRINEAVARLQDVAQLDGRDLRTLHHLGDLYRNRLNNNARAASWYAREARCHEQEGAAVRAIAAWRLVVRCAPARLEAYERIGALYVDLGRVPDARVHYETSARELLGAGLSTEAAILRAHLDAIEPMVESVVTRPPSAASVPAEEPDADALSLAAEREQYARLYYHHGLHALARQQLDDLIASHPDHVPARQLLVDVCRGLGDAEAAAEHLRVLTDLLRREGGSAPAADAARNRAAEAPGHGAPDEPCELPPFEEWSSPDVSAAEPDVTVDLMDAVRDEVERVVDGLWKRAGASGATAKTRTEE